MTNRMKSAIWINGNKLEMDYPQFNGGERNIRVPKRYLKTVQMGFTYILRAVSVHALLFDSNSIMDLLLVCDSIKRMGVENINLTIPYMPYARQDRVCNYGEAHSLKVFCDLVNSIGAKSVTIYDPHSDVCEALINNVKIIKQKDPILPSEGIPTQLYDVIISPDGGSIKKCSDLVQGINKSHSAEVLTRMESAQKIRNIKTGKIEEVVFNPIHSIDEKRCCIVDDLADVGGSFFYLGKEIRENYSPEVLDLYVTHGLFIEGTKNLYEIFDNIYTLDYISPNDIKIIRLK